MTWHDSRRIFRRFSLAGECFINGRKGPSSLMMLIFHASINVDGFTSLNPRSAKFWAGSSSSYFFDICVKTTRAGALSVNVDAFVSLRQSSANKRSARLTVFLTEALFLRLDKAHRSVDVSGVVSKYCVPSGQESWVLKSRVILTSITFYKKQDLVTFCMEESEIIPAMYGYIPV
jgi:hypothetical protein